MIFTVLQLQDKCLEQRQDLYLLFIDPTTAFDTVSRPGLWSILSKLACPPKFISTVWSLHDGMMARVIDNGDVSDSFPVASGVKQGCVLAPTLFRLLFAEMSAGLAKTSAGTMIRYRTEERFFYLRRLKPTPKCKELWAATSCLQTIVHWLRTTKRTCNAWVTVSLLLPRPSC